MNCIEVIQGNQETFKIWCVKDIRGGIKIEDGKGEYFGSKLELSTDINSNNFLTLFYSPPQDYPHGIVAPFTTIPDFKKPVEVEAKKTLHMRGSISFQTEDGEMFELFPFEDPKYHFWLFKIEHISNVFFGRFKPYIDVGNILAVGHLINRSKGLESPEYTFLSLHWSGQTPFTHRVETF